MIIGAEKLTGIDERVVGCVMKIHDRTVNQYDTLIVHGYRSIEHQDALYAQGRQTLNKVNELRAKAKLSPIKDEENHKVTKAKGGQSAHNFHKAVDIVGELKFDNDKQPEWSDFDYWNVVKEEAEKAGLKNLWSIGDYGHIETLNWK